MLLVYYHIFHSIYCTRWFDKVVHFIDLVARQKKTTHGTTKHKTKFALQIQKAVTAYFKVISYNMLAELGRGHERKHP